MPFRTAVLALAAALATGCALTSHAVRPAALGTSSSSSAMLSALDQPGPLEVETVNSADWSVPLGGLVDLHDPKAKAAHLEDRDEPIQIYFHVVRHPTRGTFIIDTGVERALRDAPEKAAARGIVSSVMHLERLKVHVPLADWIAQEKQPLAGVLMTHLHFDHVTGMPDVPKGTPIYAGAGEAEARAFANLVVQGVTDRALEGQAPVSEWQFQPDPDGRFAGVLDVFGDGSLWAISVPGHTKGSTAYLARTKTGPVLFTGDTSHSAWGWRNGVAPGDYTEDHAKNEDSLARLEKLVAEHPSIDVRLGHQSLK